MPIWVAIILHLHGETGSLRFISQINEMIRLKMIQQMIVIGLTATLVTKLIGY